MYMFAVHAKDVSMALVDGLSLFLVEMRDVDALTLLRLFRNLRLVRLLKMTDRFRLFKDVIISLGYGSEWTSVYMETGAPWTARSLRP